MVENWGLIINYYHKELFQLYLTCAAKHVFSASLDVWVWQ